MAAAVTIYTDGGSRGNPGPAAAGFVLLDRAGRQLYAMGEFIGTATNNIAEYTALLRAVGRAKQLKAQRLRIFSDSELMVRQITGQYKVKNPNIKVIHSECMKLLGEFESWSIQHFGRDENTLADELVNRALDKKGNVEEKSDKDLNSTRQAEPAKLAVLISGSGRTMLNIFEQIKAGKLNAEIRLVISSRSDTAGVQRAKQAGLKIKIIRKKDYPDIAEFSRQIEKELSAAGIELVIQGGWLCLWRIPEEFENRVMNIHPALLPGFAGKGMWGHRVHEAVIKAGCKVSGCTVHFCTNEYDKGPIVVQKACIVKEDDTPETLAERVFGVECIAYPEAVNLFIQGRITVEGGRTRVSR